MGVYQVVYAATNNNQHPAGSSTGTNSKSISVSPPDKGDERGLESIVKRIREQADKAESIALLRASNIPARYVYETTP